MGKLSSMMADAFLTSDAILPIMERVAKTDDCHDVLTGNAGLILASRNRHDKRWIRFVDIAADHLVQSSFQHDGYPMWPIGNRARSENASFAHGNAGIGTALMFAYRLTGDATYWRTALKAMESDCRFALSGGLWRDTRKPGNELTANWCHGITGMAVSRILWLEQDKDSGRELLTNRLRSGMMNELKDSLCYLLSSIHDLGSFSLCHGVSGSIQVLLYAFEHHLLDGQQVRTLNENINDFIRFGLTVDWRCGTSNYYCYSLMTGLAGVLALLKQIKSENICLEPLIPLCQVKD